MIALLDACVLYPPALRDLFMWLAVGMVYQPRWSEAIHEEWMRNVLKNRSDLTRERLERTRRQMDQIDPASLVTDYEVHIPALTLPDPDDRHVLAAAIEAGASVVVTFNLSDFPERALRPHSIQALHPDRLLCTLFDADPEAFTEAVHKHRTSLKNPPKTVEDYLQTLRDNALVNLATRLEDCRSEM